MPIYEDLATTNQIRDSNRSWESSTKGFRLVKDIGLDDLTYKVQQHFEADQMLGFFRDRVLALGDNILQSPLERAIFAFFLISDFGIGIRRDQIHVVLPGDDLPLVLQLEASVAICPQHQVEGYYLDFGIFINTGKQMLAFDFECDGLEFHGSRNSQISHDFNRDIAISKSNFRIYRCSGQAINKHPLYEVEKFSEVIRSEFEGKRSPFLSN